MIPKNCYKYISTESDVFNGGFGQVQDKGFKIKKIDTEKEILLWFEGHDVPYRPYAPVKLLCAINIFKSFLVFIHPMLIFGLITKKQRNKFIQNLNKIALRTVREHILLRKHRSDFEKELFLFVYYLMEGLGIDHNPSTDFAEYVAFTIEHDSFYRDLFQTVLCGELEWSKLDSTSRGKFGKIKLLMKLPPVKRLVNNALQKVDVEKLKPDYIDNYWLQFKT
jgi:hypothetical protein